MESEPKDLKPLFGVFSVVILLSTVSWFLHSSTLMDLGLFFMAYFFLVFGSFKAYNLEGFREAFESYDPLAERFGSYSLIYPFVEISLGLSYLFLVFYSLVSVSLWIFGLTFVIMAMNASGVLHSLVQGRELKCACLGDVFNVPMTWVTLLEDMLMAAMALWMFVSVL